MAADRRHLLHGAGWSKPKIIKVKVATLYNSNISFIFSGSYVGPIWIHTGLFLTDLSRTRGLAACLWFGLAGWLWLGLVLMGPFAQWAPSQEAWSQWGHLPHGPVRLVWPVWLVGLVWRVPAVWPVQPLWPV